MDDRAGLAGVYRGDAALDTLLKEVRSPYDAAGVRELVAGVLAAPTGPDPGAWLQLVAPRMTPSLAAQLAAVRAELAKQAPASESAPGATAARASELRAELARRGVHGFLIPRADEHQGEYVPARARRLTWLTGFTGSAGLAVVLGHNYTCWLRFKGGKGIATSAGVLAGIVPWALLIIMGLWMLFFALTRYVSVGSLVASFTLPFATWFTTKNWTLTVVTGAMGALAIYKHKANIERLLKGTENRIGGPKK